MEVQAAKFRTSYNLLNDQYKKTLEMVKSNIPQDDSINQARMERKLQDALKDLENIQKHETEIEKQLSILSNEKANGQQ